MNQPVEIAHLPALRTATRTHPLHDPIDYKLKDIGRWLLSGAAPEPGAYS